MKKTKKILTVFAVFLYLISFAYAQDYSLFSGKFYDLKLEKETDKVCGGINKKYKGELINNGDQKSDVELTANGPNWVSIDKNNFSVAANGKQEFELNAGIPANAKGFFDVVVNAAIGNLPPIKSEKKLSIHVVPKYDCYKPDILTDEKITN